MIFRASVLGVFVSIPSLFAAQTVIVGRAVRAVPAGQDPSVEVISVEAQEPQLSVQPGAVPAQANAPKKPSARAAKLKTLEYDRKPSSILKAWANPPKPPKE